MAGLFGVSPHANSPHANSSQRPRSISGETEPCVLLRAEDLRLVADTRTVLDGITLDVGAGDVVCIAGANGSGKSLLLRILAGLRLPSSGRVATLGHSGSVSLVAIDTVYAGLTLQVGEFLHVVGSVPPADARETAAEVGLPAWQTVGTLSRGEQQRLLLATAILSRTAVTLLDNPGRGLDSAGYDLAETVIENLATTERAVVVTTTDPEMVGRLHDAALWSLVDGRLHLIRPGGRH